MNHFRLKQGVHMPSTDTPNPIRIGLIAGEPLRMEGLNSIFERQPEPGQVPLLPVTGTLESLMADPAIEFLVVDLNSSSGRLESLKEIRRTRPTIRLIVIGPEGNEQLVMDAIIAGARAFLDLTAAPRVVREAIEVVVSGSIWAPRRLLSALIDRLLANQDGTANKAAPYLTFRERQVLDLILQARSNKEIASELGIEERTVKAHVGKLMRKTGAENRIELSLRALNGSLMSKGGAGTFAHERR